MNSTFLSSAIELLGWVLVHFLWQAGLIALLLGVFLNFTRRSAPQVRYAASGAALLLMLCCAAGTLGWQWLEKPSRAVAAEIAQAPGTADHSVAVNMPVTADSATTAVEAVPAGSPRPKTEFVIIPKTAPEQTKMDTAGGRLRLWLPWMVALWAAGVAFFSLRLLNGWRTVKKWRESGSALLPGDWAARFDRICQTMGLKRAVRLLSSASLAVPVVIGWLKPVVLVPAGLFAGLTPAQLEALLAHELAHVRRQDYLVNLLQSMVETLFFYHPAVWWVSAQLRKEREHCCDDAASAHSGGVLDYARALTALEEMRGLTPALGMSASGGSLLHRVRRLAGVSEEQAGIGLPLGLVTLGAAALTLPFTLLRAAELPFVIPQAAHTGNEKHSAYCVHDGGETHFTLVSDIPFTSATSSGGNPKARTWHDDGKLTFDGGEDLTFSRKSESPETLNLITGGKDGRLTATPFDLGKGRIFLIAPGRAPQQLALKAPPVTTVKGMETLCLDVALYDPAGERAYATGRFYEKKGQLKAAALYYAEVLKHPENPHFDEVRRWMARAAAKQTQIKLDNSGVITLEDETVDEGSLEAKLTGIVRQNKDRPVILLADGEAMHSKVTRILDIVRKTGVTQVAVAAPETKNAVSGEEEAPERLKQLVGEAQRLFDLGNFKEAKARCEEALKAYPASPDARRLMERAEKMRLGMKENPDPFAVPSDPDKFAEARKTGIMVNVTDASGQRSIPEFRVIAGVKAGSVGARDTVNWQPHTLHTGVNGALIWPLEKAYDVMALRVEADGYEPQVFTWIEKGKGPQDLFFQLVESAGLKGLALLPGGKPAAGATVALAMVQRDAVLEGGKLRHADKPLPEKVSDQWRLPVIVKADSSGRFVLPPETDSTAAVLVVHESGVREMSLAELKKAADGRVQDEGERTVVKLQPWGRIEGKVFWGDKAGANQKVSLIVHRDTYGYPGVVAQYENTISGPDGRFVFERALPGLTQLSCPVPADPNGSSGISEVNMSGQLIHVTVKPGVNSALIGGGGRTVKGKLTGRTSWEGVTFHFHPTAPHIGFPGDDEMWKAWSAWQQSPTGPLFFRSGLKVNADGTFEIPNALPGHYQIFFSREGEPSHVASGSFHVEQEKQGVKADAQVLPDMPANPAVPSTPPAKDPDKGKTGSASPQKGVPVLQDIPVLEQLFRIP